LEINLEVEEKSSFLIDCKAIPYLFVNFDEWDILYCEIFLHCAVCNKVDARDINRNKS
jgi:hypothetical protein